jgi:serine protease AprX
MRKKRKKKTEYQQGYESNLERDLLLGRATIPPGLHDPVQRKTWQLPADEEEPGFYMIELNLRYRQGVQRAAAAFERLYKEVLGLKEAKRRKPELISRSYFKCLINVNEWKALTKRDEEKVDPRDRIIYKIWPDFPISPLIDRSVSTVKADAAFQSYSATGRGICWGVIDSGIDYPHLHFGDTKDIQSHTLLHPDVSGPSEINFELFGRSSFLDTV